MGAGLFGLLDDVAGLAKLAAASLDDLGASAGHATVKAAGVVVDDTAVTPQYVHGVTAARELPVIRRIALGSLRNKLLIILPVALVLSELAAWLLPPLLVVGGTYLAFEGAEKAWEHLRHRDDHVGDLPTPHADRVVDGAVDGAVGGAVDEDTVVREAVRTDLILSSEIMVIALDSVADEGFWSRLVILVVVALVITVAVYGVVGVLVKADDVGLAVAERSSGAIGRLGAATVDAMPRVLAGIGAVGVVAMLWVGGHILLAQVAEMGWHPPYDALHRLEHRVRHAVDVAVIGPSLSWLAGTVVSALVGLLVGALAVVVVHVLPVDRHAAAPEAH